LKEYAVYKGEQIVCIGTAKECAEYMGILAKSFSFYLTPSYKRRIDTRKKPKNFITVINLDDETEE